MHYSSRGRSRLCLPELRRPVETLLASELFGHEQGAFTGATEHKIGKFEAANQGTLMLDEIGEMSPGCRPSSFACWKGTLSNASAAASRSRSTCGPRRHQSGLEKDCWRAVSAGTCIFASTSWRSWFPRLREQPEDIPELANYFLQRFDAEIGRKIRGFSEEAMRELFKYRWPGNIRELKNVVERAVVLCTGQFIGTDDLLLSKIATAGDTADRRRLNPGFIPCSLADMERPPHPWRAQSHRLEQEPRRANVLGIERSTLDRKIRRYLLAEDSQENPE